MMLIRTYGGRAGALQAAREGSVAIVVDALRASATTASLLHYGAQQLVVVEHVDQAFAQRERYPGCWLAGERDNDRVPGFDLGNSPLQAEEERLPATVVFTSTNMSRCCVGAREAPAVLLGSTVTATVCARLAVHAAQSLGTSITLVPAGAADDEQRFVMEDYLASGAILARMRRMLEAEFEPGDDATRAALKLYEAADDRGLEAAFQATDNGQGLARQGYGADVRFASRLDVFATVPRLDSTYDLGDGGAAAVLRSGLSQ